jgi:L-lactate utilization protein LutC
VSENGVFFTSCEHLIAQNGSILVNDLQFKEYKLHQLPELIIVFSKTSQLLESIQDGLKQIKKNYTHNIPGNITAIKNFKKENESQKDFLSYGSSNKDIYLILLENL